MQIKPICLLHCSALWIIRESILLWISSEYVLVEKTHKTFNIFKCLNGKMENWLQDKIRFSFKSISIQSLQNCLIASLNSQFTLGRPCLILWTSVQKCTDSLWPHCTKKDLTHSIPSSSITAVAARPASHQSHQMECLLTCLQKELLANTFSCNQWGILITPVHLQNLFYKQLGQHLFLTLFFLLL